MRSFFTSSSRNTKAKEPTRVKYQRQLPSPQAIARLLKMPADTTFLLIFDRRLNENEAFQDWKELFEHRVSVSAGESLKDIDQFPEHIKKISKALGASSPNKMCFIACGGGSLGDFAGFAASVYKRGVDVVQVPSTWLAAMDSAHGGKTALNVGAVKNQVGTFHSAKAVYIVHDLLDALPEKHVKSAFGELVKMAIIEGGDLYRRLNKARQMDQRLLWRVVPLAVLAKYRVVNQDPFEKKGQRMVLNLGHTFGHALESHYRILHGRAVGLGLMFSLDWSRHEGMIGPKTYEELRQLVRRYCDLDKRPGKGEERFTSSQLRKLLIQDKKMDSSEHVSFLFIRAVGKVARKTVKVSDILAEAKRQGWTA